jgi:hypothetical protein
MCICQKCWKVMKAVANRFVCACGFVLLVIHGDPHPLHIDVTFVPPGVAVSQTSGTIVNTGFPFST